MMNQYFDLFGLKPCFDIHTETLEQAYRLLAARFHPDKFAATSAFEQKQAMMMASTINEAYRILKNPTDRAAYLLKQQGIDADSPEHTLFPPDFLMQQMEWREMLEEALAAKDEISLVALSAEIATEQRNLYEKLQTAFSNNQYEEAAAEVRKSRFLDKLHREIQTALP